MRLGFLTFLRSVDVSASASIVVSQQSIPTCCRPRTRDATGSYGRDVLNIRKNTSVKPPTRDSWNTSETLVSPATEVEAALKFIRESTRPRELVSARI